MSVHRRSMLIVPGDSERKLVKGADSGADALVTDLEDSVPDGPIDLARRMVREYLSTNHDREREQLWAH
jgi:citrate lyase subunit beta / citryl-CoA lyase